jgi:hypothetical protein
MSYFILRTYHDNILYRYGPYLTFREANNICVNHAKTFLLSEGLPEGEYKIDIVEMRFYLDASVEIQLKKTVSV